MVLRLLCIYQMGVIFIRMLLLKAGQEPPSGRVASSLWPRRPVSGVLVSALGLLSIFLCTFERSFSTVHTSQHSGLTLAVGWPCGHLDPKFTGCVTLPSGVSSVMRPGPAGAGPSWLCRWRLPRAWLLSPVPAFRPVCGATS